MIKKEGRETETGVLRRSYNVSLTHKSERAENQAVGFSFIEAVGESLFAGTTAAEKAIVYKYDRGNWERFYVGDFTGGVPFGDAVPFSDKVLLGIKDVEAGRGILLDLLTGDTTVFPDEELFDLEVFGGDLYLATAGGIYKTTDLSSFSLQKSTEESIYWSPIKEYNDKLWVGIGTTLYSSPDGSTWTNQGNRNTPTDLLTFRGELLIFSKANVVWAYDGSSFYKLATLGTGGDGITSGKMIPERVFFTTGHSGAVWTLESKSWTLHPIAYPTITPYSVTVYNGKLWIGGAKETYIGKTKKAKASVLETSELHPYNKIHGNFHSHWEQVGTSWETGFPCHGYHWDLISLYIHNDEDVDVDYRVYTRPKGLSGGDVKHVFANGTIASGDTEVVNSNVKGWLGVDLKSASSPSSGKVYAYWMV